MFPLRIIFMETTHKSNTYKVLIIIKRTILIHSNTAQVYLIKFVTIIVINDNIIEQVN
jgi:hypothetical protein